MKNNHSIFLVLSVCVTIFVAFVFGYMYRMINLSIERTVKTRMTISSAILAKSREQGFLQSYNLTASKWAILPDYYVKSDKIVDFIEAVESFGEQSNSKVTISSIDADSITDSPVGKEGTLRTHITVSGSWSSIMKTLSLAETLPYKISISNVQASGAGDMSSGVVKEKMSESSAKAWNLSFDLQVAMLVATSTIPTIK